jgi:hypothetical protein
MAGATAIITGHTGALVGIAEPSWATIPGKTTSSDTHRISTVLHAGDTSVVSMAVDFMVVVLMAAAGTGAE